ncbi:MAG: cytochrome c-type biogenesis protein CcmH [Chromatiales bacterium]|nr:cytochrome c-type biogenesis protein CcmH [Chromatiales bacterium]
MSRWLLLLLFMLPLTGVAIDIKDPLDNPEQQALYERLLKEVRCLVCQNQPIGDSNAPLASDLRREIRNLIEQGQDEQEIRGFLLARYGDFVLYRPRFTAATALLWFAPGLLLLAGFWALWRVVQRRASLPIPDEDEEQAELLAAEARRE